MKQSHLMDRVSDPKNNKKLQGNLKIGVRNPLDKSATPAATKKK